MDSYEDLIEFYQDSIELYHGNVDAFYLLDIDDEDDLARRLEQYLDHLIYMIKSSYKIQCPGGFVEAINKNCNEQVACIVKDTYVTDRFNVIVYHQSIPLMDRRYSTLDKAYKELIQLGFTLPKKGALEQHLKLYT
ncbi:hypothetical protein [Vibrio sp. THAF190c]|uniref:hypothetical protein n=1 Tax=Vibrio sp. THAF190c TaxID=2587865 RepID=UPI0012690D35|nr:hypothetical protein [Vibrio sp. THAF190c]QFT13423.1 hypothetical protein FIV04_26070 [Vibrio sp. THAF190c]